MTQPEHIPYAAVPPQSGVDLGHLRALAICHYVWGGLVCAFSSLFLIYVAFGIAIASGSMPTSTQPGEPSPQVVGLMVGFMGGCGVLIGWLLGILTIISGRSIAQQRRRVFTFVMAGISCLSFPLGTVLGVFTFIVLARPSVKALYDMNAAR